MGRRSRRRERTGVAQEPALDYSDDEGNVLRLRHRLSAASVRQLGELEHRPSADTEDRWHRRTEFLFERLAVSWTIAGLPLEDQRELLGRYRMADEPTRRWVRETLDRHLEATQPELLS